MQLDNMTVRFFAYYVSQETDELELTEISEQDFLLDVSEGSTVEYERHTVRENGVSQICLTAHRMEG